MELVRQQDAVEVEDMRSYFEQLDRINPLIDSFTQKTVNREHYFMLLGSLLNSHRLQKVIKATKIFDPILYTVAFVIQMAQEQLSIRSADATQLANCYKLMLARRQREVGVEEILDSLLSAKSLRLWSRSTPQMKEYKHSAVMDRARQHNERVVTSGIACSSCKSTKTVATSKQTRGRDEGETAFILCLDCNKSRKAGD